MCNLSHHSYHPSWIWKSYMKTSRIPFSMIPSLLHISLPLNPLTGPLTSLDFSAKTIESADFRLRVIQYNHDHILSGHFGQNKTIELIHRKYVWPNLWTMVKHFCNSCTTCKCSKAPHHKPYGLLKQLPVLELPWNSISINFI